MTDPVDFAVYVAASMLGCFLLTAKLSAHGTTARDALIITVALELPTGLFIIHDVTSRPGVCPSELLGVAVGLILWSVGVVVYLLWGLAHRRT